jgi:DNA-binding NarL/FixJ family response regulator
MKTITVLLADDHNIVRAGMRALLETAEDIQIVGEAANGQQALSETKRLQPDVVLMDLAMPLMNGAEAARRITEQAPASKVLILSSYSDFQRVMSVIRSGVTGYLMKESASEDLLMAIRETAAGNTFFSPVICERLLTQWRGTSPDAIADAATAPKLTNREIDVLQLIAEGYLSKQIAGILSISTKTIEKHRSTLMFKLARHNIARLTRYAMATGVIESGQIPNMPFPSSGPGTALPKPGKRGGPPRRQLSPEPPSYRPQPASENRGMQAQVEP